MHRENVGRFEIPGPGQCKIRLRKMMCRSTDWTIQRVHLRGIHQLSFLSRREESWLRKKRRAFQGRDNSK